MANSKPIFLGFAACMGGAALYTLFTKMNWKQKATIISNEFNQSGSTLLIIGGVCSGNLYMGFTGVFFKAITYWLTYRNGRVLGIFDNLFDPAEFIEQNPNWHGKQDRMLLDQTMNK